MVKLIKKIFQKKSEKTLKIEEKISNFYLSSIGVDIYNVNELKKYKVDFKKRIKQLDVKYFKDDRETILIKLLSKEKSIALLNNEELSKDLTVMKDVIGYIENKNNNITIYANNLEHILG